MVVKDIRGSGDQFARQHPKDVAYTYAHNHSHIVIHICTHTPQFKEYHLR